MGKIKDYKYRFKKQLLIKEGTESTAYITAMVENTKRNDCGEVAKADIKLAFESVYESIALDFDIEFPDQQKEAIKKIRKFETMLKKFRKAIEKEVKLQNKRAYKILKAKKIRAR